MLKEFSYKKFGSLSFSFQECNDKVLEQFKEHIKVLYLPKSSRVHVDFIELKMDSDSLLFINPSVVVRPLSETDVGQRLLHFNRDFYCVEIHDQEVACDGILYNNVFEIPFINLSGAQSTEIQNHLREYNLKLKMMMPTLRKC